MSETIKYVDPNALKPDPTQPRTNFNEEDLERLAETYASQGMVNPIEADENNIIILGERRWKAAKIAGLLKVPVRTKKGLTPKTRLERQLIDDAQRKQLSPQERVWAWATGIVNINTKENHTIGQIKQIYKTDYEVLSRLIEPKEYNEKGKKQGQGQAELSRIIGVSQPNISNYMQFFKVSKELRLAFMDSEGLSRDKARITIGHIMEVTRLMDKEEQARLERELVEQIARGEKPDSPLELREYVTDANEKFAIARDARSKELRKKKKKKEPPEPSETEVEKAAKKKAEKKPEKTMQEKAEASLVAVEKKIGKVKKLGVDVTVFQKRLEDVKVLSNFKQQWNEVKDLKKELDAAIREAKKTEAEKKREKELRKKAEEDAKKKLLEDEEFLRKAAERQRQLDANKVVGKVSGDIELSEEEIKTFRENMAQFEEDMKKILGSDVVQKRGKLFQNWLGHVKMTDFLGMVTCPVCGAGCEQLQWKCHGISLADATEMVRKAHEETYEGGEN